MGTSDSHNGNAVFNECSSLVSIDLRNINSIYDGTFTNCVNLVHLKNIKKNVLLGQANAGGEGPIYNLPKLTTKLYFTNARLTGTQEIRKAFFRQNGTTTIWLPNAAERLNASYVFYNSYNLKEIVIQKPTVMTISNSSALGNLAAAAKVYVPNDLVISYRKASYWSAIYTRILPIIDGPSIIYGNGTYSFIPNTPFTGFTDIEWTLEENDYLTLTTEQDGSATIVASGMTSETDTVVQLGYSFEYDGNDVSGTINIPVSYREPIQFEDDAVRNICVSNWGGIYGTAAKVPGIPGEVTVEQILGSPAKKAANVISRLRIVSLTSTFSTTTPIYGLKYVQPASNSGDYTVNFDTDSGHTLQIYCYYSRCWYPDGASAYGDISARWTNLGNRNYVTFFSDQYSNSYVDTYVTFKNIAGYRPGSYDGRVSALVDSNDL